MTNRRSVSDSFLLTGRVVVITGGAGLLGCKHGEAVAEMGGIPVLLDIDEERVQEATSQISAAYDCPALGLRTDVTQLDQVKLALEQSLRHFGRVDVLINNAANNPKMEKIEGQGGHWSRLEQFPLSVWDADLAVGLTGAFLCSRVFGTLFADQRRGVILNIASDLAIIGPDQRIYHRPGLHDSQQPVKPVTYSVVKAGLLGLTRYLATYWADKGVRVNALLPGGVYANQDAEFVQRLTNLIPMGRMAHEDEYKAAVVFLISDASSYVTGAYVSIDGGRTAW